MSLSRRISIAATAACALGLSVAGAASAQGTVDPTDPVGSLPGLLEDALTQQEGCDFPGILVPVIAQVSREAVEGCGFFETDPAHPSNQQGG